MDENEEDEILEMGDEDDDPFATFTVWASDADDEAYRAL